jgi:regulator of RNase E activity RraA
LFRLIEAELYTPVVGDVLDALGCRQQFLPQPIQPMLESMRLCGRAMPMLMVDVHGRQPRPFGRLTEALDQVRPGEVCVVTGGLMRCAYWGELLTATVRVRGARGAVIDGFHRDTPKVLEQNWPVFSRGRFAQDSSVRAAVSQFRCPVDIAGVWAEPGDLVIADVDGVLVVPQRHETEAIEGALRKARAEKLVRKAIEGGMSSTAAFEKYGVL